MNYTIGVSVGNLSDRSAVSVVRITDARLIECVHLQVWQPGTPHTQVLADIVNITKLIQEVKRVVYKGKIVSTAPINRVAVVIDVTVAGAAVGSMFAKAMSKENVRVSPFTITAGTQTGHGRVPKRDLASIMRVLLEERQFTYATQLEHAATLQAELQHFKMENTSGNDNEIDWRTRPHDDLVIATALVCWWMEPLRVRRKARSYSG
jgi:hypothetical protein